MVEPLHTIVEAAYRLSTPRSEWLASLGLACESVFGQDKGTVAIIVDASDIRRPKALDFRSTRTIAGIDRVVDEAFSSLEPAWVEDQTNRPMATVATESTGLEQRGVQVWLDAFGARDLLTVVGLDPSGVGVVLAVNLAEHATESARSSPSLTQLAGHVLSAYRLRESNDDARANDALFETDGTLAFATDDVRREKQALDDLGNAVRALAELRSTRSGHSADAALDRFTCRIDATWSVVAGVEHGSEQWIVARRNEPSILPLPDALSLSRREQQVISLLLLNRTPKVVAYELGIAHSTVRVLISRALSKVGVKNIEELRARLSSAI